MAGDVYHLLWTAAKRARATSAVVFILLTYFFTIASPASIALDNLMAYSCGLVKLRQAAESFCVVLFFSVEFCVIFQAIYFYRLFREVLDY